MGWNGAIIGGCIGSFLGGVFGRFSAIIGAVAGHFIEEYRKKKVTPNSPGAVFCATAAAMLAKMAKADGRITKVEIAAVENAFIQLGFSAAAREYAVNVFRKAKDDSRSIYEYARDFTAVVRNSDVRTIFYELLWDIACADGDLSVSERDVLEKITVHLGINPGWFGVFYREKCHAGPAGGACRGMDGMGDAYEQLGVPSSATDEEVKKAYRDMAKRYHPDALKAQGLPEELVSRATERMSKINAAWAEIKKARGL